MTDDIKEYEQSKKINMSMQGVPLLTVIQIIVCTLIIISVLVLKSIGGDLYQTIKDWYTFELNNSVLIEDDTEIYKAVFKSVADNDWSRLHDIKLSNGSKFPESEALSITPVCISVPLSMPVKKGVITSNYGYRNGEEHKGIDIATDKNASIYSVMSGVVERSEYSKSYGNYVLVDHKNGIKTIYAHCSDTTKKAGDSVNRGEEVGFVGRTGRATGDHLHFEILVDNKNYNPMFWLNGGYTNAV